MDGNESKRKEHDLADDVEEGLEQAGDDLQNTVKIFMELVPTEEDEEPGH